MGHPDFGETFPCSCTLARFESERRDRLTKLSNLGALAGVTFDSLASLGIEGTTVDQVRAFAAAPANWLVLLGPTGSGKTRIAAAIANQRIEAGEPVFFVTAADLLDHLRSTYAPDSDLAYDEMFKQVRSIPLLVLDDLGDESATPWAKEKLAQVLTHRYNERLPTVITTPGPVERLDERVAGRLADSAVSRIVRLRGHGPSEDTVDVLDFQPPGMTFESFDATGGGLGRSARENLQAALGLARGFAQHPEGWLVFTGTHGCGKTHLAAAIAAYRREQGDNVILLLVPKLLDYLRSTFGRPSPEAFRSPSPKAFQTNDRLGRTDLLILDDFDPSVITEWASNTVYQVLNQRKLYGLPTVVTSTMDTEEDVDPRLWSHFSDMRLTNLFKIDAPDYRTGRAYASKPPAPASRRRPSKPRGS